LQNRPLPSSRFPADHGDGRDALHGKCKKNEQRQRAAESQVVFKGALETQLV
jgi:hypothetical protein